MTEMRIFPLIQKSLIDFNLSIQIVILIIVNVCFSLTDTTETLPISPPSLVDCYLPCYQPSNDFTIIAHATYYRRVAHGDFSHGGAWTIKLCDNIRQYAETKEVTDILIKTRDEVINETKFNVQGPFHIVNCECGYLVKPR